MASEMGADAIAANRVSEKSGAVWAPLGSINL